MESEPMLTPREKSPLPEKFSSEEDRTQDTASSRTASPTQPLSYSGPLPNHFSHSLSEDDEEDHVEEDDSDSDLKLTRNRWRNCK